MHVRAGSAFGIGVVAAAVMTAVLALVRAAGLTEMNLAMMLGAMLTQEVGPATWVLGFAIHLIAGGVFALVYAGLFDRMGGATVTRGIGIAVVHSLLSGLLMAVLPWIHPAVAEHPELRAPGFLAAGFGWVTAVGFVALHLLYGAMVGGWYRVGAPVPATAPTRPGAASREAAHLGGP